MRVHDGRYRGLLRCVRHRVEHFLSDLQVKQRVNQQ